MENGPVKPAQQSGLGKGRTFAMSTEFRATM